MQTQAALVRADGGIELHAEPAVDLHLAAVVHPAHAELDEALRLDDALDHTGRLQIGTLLDHRLNRLEHLADRLQELSFARVPFFNGFVDGSDVLVAERHIKSP